MTANRPVRPGFRRAVALVLAAAFLTPAAAPARAAAAGASGAGGGGSPADSSRAPVLPPLTESHPNTVGILASGAGVAAGVGLAVWFKNEADRRYDRYRTTADPARARDAFDAAQRYDRATLIGWTVAEVSFVTLFYYLTREEKRPLVPVRGEPVVRAGGDGIQLGIRVTP